MSFITPIFCHYAGSLLGKQDPGSASDTKSSASEASHYTPPWKLSPETMFMKELGKLMDYDPRSALELARSAVNFDLFKGPVMGRIAETAQQLEQKLFPQNEIMAPSLSPAMVPGMAPAPS